MRCPNCDHDQKRKDGMVCGQCGYPFALDPKQPPRVADRRFVRAVAKVSGDGARWFTIEQLHGQLNRRSSNPVASMVGSLFLGAVVVVVGTIVVDEAGPSSDARGLLTALVVAAAVAIVTTGFLRARRPPPLDRTARLVARWQTAGKPLDRLLQWPRLDGPTPAAPEADIFDYGAEAVLVVDDDLAVDLLVANGFASANRCLVVSTTGYPSRVASRAAALLASSPTTRAGVLHESGNTDAVAAARVRYGPTVVDLGLPADIARKVGALGWARNAPSIPVRALPHRLLATALPMALTSGTAIGELLAAARRGDLDVDLDDFG